MISERKLRILRDAYDRGETSYAAANAAQVSFHTARSYYAAFGPRTKGSVHGLPLYGGPAWIGKPVNSQCPRPSSSPD